MGEAAANSHQIATAAEEQSAVANEIPHNVCEQTGSGMTQTQATAGQLKRLAEELQSMVGRFRV